MTTACFKLMIKIILHIHIFSIFSYVPGLSSEYKFNSKVNLCNNNQCTKMIKCSFFSVTLSGLFPEVVALKFINHFSCLKLDLAILSFMGPNHPHFLGIQFEMNFIYRTATFWQIFPHACFSKYCIPNLLK